LYVLVPVSDGDMEVVGRLGLGCVCVEGRRLFFGRDKTKTIKSCREIDCALPLSSSPLRRCHKVVAHDEA
jgi:hypothetical protein